MTVLWIALRVLAILAALVVLFLTPLFVQTNGSTSIEPAGAVIDLVALAVLAAAAWSLWRTRSRAS